MTIDDLVQREGLYYQKFTDVPFTGELNEGSFRGSFKDGRIEGYFEIYLGTRLTNRVFLSMTRKTVNMRFITLMDSYLQKVISTMINRMACGLFIMMMELWI